VTPGIVFDAHQDIVYEVPAEERGLSDHLFAFDLHLDKLKAGGIDAEIFAICIAAECLRISPAAETLREIDAFQRELAANAAQVTLATTARHIRDAKARGQIAGILGLEGAEPLEGEIGLLRIFYQLGVRNIGLTWNLRNAAADGVAEHGTGGGLTQFGASVVKEANRLGMMVDVAHLARRGLEDVLAIAERPIIDSHTASAALFPHRRNRSDAEFEAIAKNGGVIGVVNVPEFLHRERLKASIDTLLDHVDHIVSVAGIDHVGFGADFGVWHSHHVPALEPWVRGLEDASKWAALSGALRDRDYSEADTEKLMGENFMRVVTAVLGS
jgi:membrane dipeptidase